MEFVFAPAFLIHAWFCSQIDICYFGCEGHDLDLDLTLMVSQHYIIQNIKADPLHYVNVILHSQLHMHISMHMIPCFLDESGESYIRR